VAGCKTGVGDNLLRFFISSQKMDQLPELLYRKHL
jgi:hypothetical protein